MSMADPERTENSEEDPAPTKKSKLPLLIGVVLALALGGAGFYVMYSGILSGGYSNEQAAEDADGGHRYEASAKDKDIAFVPIDPLIVSLGQAASSRHLKFTAQLEVASGAAADVTRLMPRVLDVLNGYLRAVDMADLEDPASLIRLRAQMLRRVQVVTGEGQVRDLLVTEFVLN